jgi:hypothetical protein
LLLCSRIARRRTGACCSILLQNTPLHPVAEWGRQRFSADEPAARCLADLEKVHRRAWPLRCARRPAERERDRGRSAGAASGSRRPIMVTKPDPAPIDELDLRREVLLGHARTLRKERDALSGPRSAPDPLPVGVKPIGRWRSEIASPDPETDPIGEVQDDLARFYAGEAARYIEDFVPLLDDIRDRWRRLKAMETLNLLIIFTHMYAQVCGEAPINHLRANHRMWRARLTNAQRVEERRERLRPLVAQVQSNFPSASPAKIAARLRKRKDFKAQFGASRRTIEADVAALVYPLETE